MIENRKLFYFELLDLLKQDPEQRFYADNGDLLRNKVYECAMKMDKALIKLLLSNDRMKKKFFTDIDGTLVFDKTAFGWAVNNKAFLQDSYTRFKNTIGLVDSREQFISSKNDVVLSFPYKDCVLEGGQTKEDQKRGEIFYNELLAPDDVDRLLSPKVFTNMKRYTKDGEEPITEFNDTDNLLIKGNNLLALSSILKRYEGKVKCIYIDPPYNTGSDSFNYNDNFNHSSWLVFMKNRLKEAYKLLRNDGYIFVQCDDNEQAYLKVLMDEIFNRNNFVNCITVKMSEASGTKVSHVDKRLIKIKEYILLYKKESIKLSPIKITKDEWDDEYNKVFINLSKEDRKYINDLMYKSNNIQLTEKDILNIDKILATLNVTSIQDALIQNNIDITNIEEVKNWKRNNSYKIFRTAASTSVKKLVDVKKQNCNSTYFSVLSSRDKLLYITKSDYEISSKNPRVQVLFADTYLSYYLGDLWTDITTTGLEAEGDVSLKKGKKPETLIKRIIDLSTEPGDIVLDYHLGSGTTCAVAHKLNRQYIGIEQLNYNENDSLARLNNVINGEQGGISKSINWQGGGSFVYCELKELNHKYIDKIQVADNNILNELYKEITESDFISYKVDINKLKESEQDFKELTIDEKRKFLIEILDKNLLYVNYCDMEDETLAVTEEEKAFTRSFYGEEV
jgi:adenine-specific DNA-methyltransferase